jgi:hypothetical protein
MTAGAELIRHDSAETSIVRGYDPGEAAAEAFGSDGHPVLRFEPADASEETTVVRLLGDGRYADAVDAEQAARAGLRQRVVRAHWASTDALVSEGAANALAQAGFDGAQHRLVVPAHAGVQLWDVITVSDAAVGLDGERFRVTGLALRFDRERGRYEHELTLGRP